MSVRDASSSFPWPPVIFATAFALATLAGWKEPMPIVPEAARGFLRFAGILVILAGVGIALAAEWRFMLAGTATLPTRPTSMVVSEGIYRYTRNPMYLGLSLSVAGVGFLINSWWFLVVLPLAVIAVTKLAIEREERYLEAKFGPDYLGYKARTRRWF
ncbi:methyltransferase family protein [Methyloferula stellata]|uniref:methyltransferase family protein n=1 Tax=Methyloferula stellata TaxID=876270 RepID=UPI00037963EB|nr:isoprenylcysteine carboxylmethyltransferase family protein [Methyloferula stellata]